MRKRILSITLAMALCLGLFAVMPLTASAAGFSANTISAGQNMTAAIETDGSFKDN